MIIFPVGFTPTKYDGYFWHTINKKLYSIKSGVLREIKYTRPNRFNHFTDGYRVSVNGNRRVLELRYLNSLTTVDHTIAIHHDSQSNDK